MTKKSKLLLTTGILSILSLTTLSVVSCSKEQSIPTPPSDSSLYDNEYGLEFNSSGRVLSSYIPKEHVVIPEYLTFNSIQSSKYYGYKVKIKSIGIEAFSNNKTIKEVTIANSVTYIGDSAFENTQLTKVSIPNSVTEIGGLAFYKTQLTKVSIPNSVTKIGWYAFDETPLTQISIPNSVTEIGRGAFKNTQLIEVTLPQNCVYFSNSFPSNCVVRGGIISNE